MRNEITKNKTFLLLFALGYIIMTFVIVAILSSIGIESIFAYMICGVVFGIVYDINKIFKYYEENNIEEKLINKVNKLSKKIKNK